MKSKDLITSPEELAFIQQALKRYIEICEGVSEGKAFRRSNGNRYKDPNAIKNKDFFLAKRLYSSYNEIEIKPDSEIILSLSKAEMRLIKKLIEGRKNHLKQRVLPELDNRAHTDPTKWYVKKQGLKKVLNFIESLMEKF